VPGTGLYQSFPRNLSADEYYALLTDDAPTDEGVNCSQTLDAGGDASEGSAIERKWKQKLSQAEYISQQRGDIPESLLRFFHAMLEPKVDWAAQLREFVTTFARNDFSWTRPNRRFVSQGIYLPGMYSDEIESLAVAIDTSGSISQAELDQMASELQGILDAFDVDLQLIYHTSVVTHTDEWSTSDGPLELQATGTGGTSHVPVFEHLTNDEPPTALICFTDAFTQFPTDVPDYPVMWAVIHNDKPVIPWGDVITIDM
jgi:predicted metal-dependent peptidase